MVQENNILRCYSCHIFQVHIVKKAKKWQCKICNEKQSVQHVYFTGSGEDCRFRVQHLNFTENNQKQQDFREALHTERKSIRVIEKRVITHSKWTKYMVSQAASHEGVSNDDEDIGNQSANFNDGGNIVEPGFTIIDNCFSETSRNQTENEWPSPLGNNPIQNTIDKGPQYDDNRDDNKTSTFSKTSFQASDAPRQNDNYKYDRRCDISSIEVRNYPRDCRTEVMDRPNHSFLSSDDSRSNFDQQNQDSTVIRRYVKRKFDVESSGPQTESDSFLCRRVRKIFKPSNLGNQSSSRKEHLRDIVKGNRKTLDQSVETRASITEDKSVSEEINHSLTVNISKPSVTKKPIFETDYDDLDDILDF